MGLGRRVRAAARGGDQGLGQGLDLMVYAAGFGPQGLCPRVWASGFSFQREPPLVAVKGVWLRVRPRGGVLRAAGKPWAPCFRVRVWIFGFRNLECLRLQKQLPALPFSKPLFSDLLGMQRCNLHHPCRLPGSITPSLVQSLYLRPVLPSHSYSAAFHYPPFPFFKGANGAGKTTTFKVVTGEVIPDSGDALVAGASALHCRGAARRALGYCPQFDGLPAAMTGGESKLGFKYDQIEWF